MTGDTEFETPKSALVVGVLMVGVGLLFVHRFAGTVMTELAVEVVGDDESWRYRGMSTLWVLGGLLGALGAAMRFRLEVWRSSLSWGLRACSMAAVLAVMAENWTVLLIASFATGASAGWLLTVLTTGLRASVGTLRLGVIVGVGFALSVGLSEAAERLAALFGDPIKGGGVVVALLVAAGSIVAPFLTPQEPSMAMEPEYRGRGLLIQWLVLTAIAVGITAAGSGATAPALWWWLALAVAPMLGGWLDAGQRRWPLIAAVGLVALALSGVVGENLAGGLTLLARSLLTVCAIYFAARGGRVWVAAGTMAWVVFLGPYVVGLLAG